MKNLKLFLMIFFMIVVPLWACGQNQWTEQCAFKECHGPDVSCAMVRYPRACPDIYIMGDFCRVYARCQMIGNECQLVKESVFDQCILCVQQCVHNSQGRHPLDCEQECRNKIKRELNKADVDGYNEHEVKI